MAGREVKRILGPCHEVSLRWRGQFDPHVEVAILAKNDGVWYESMSFSSCWLGPLIDLLRDAQSAIAGLPCEEVGLGKRFLGGEKPAKRSARKRKGRK